MKKIFSVKPVLNKKNGQLNISIPKKNFEKKEFDKLINSERLKMILEDI